MPVVMVMTAMGVMPVVPAGMAAARAENLGVRGNAENQDENEGGKGFHGGERDCVRQGGLGKVSATCRLRPRSLRSGRFQIMLSAHPVCSRA